MNSSDYYNSPEEWGSYSYVTLKEVINNYLMSRDQDDYTANTPRFKILYQAMRGLREFYFDVLREVRAIELELSPSLNVTLPPDFVNFVRISWVDDQGQLHPMAVDNSMSIAEGYLQDNDYELLFDSDGCVLTSEGIRQPLGADTTESISEGSDTPCTRYSFISNFSPNLDTSRVFENGRYRLDKNTGIIQFGSDAFGRSIVLEYISDGLYTGCEGRPESDIRIHKFAEGAIMNYIYFELIKRSRNVPANEKHRAKKEYFNSIRTSKRRINTLRKDDLLQIFRASSKWIK